MRIIDTISNRCGRIFSYLAIPLVGGVFYEVVARYFFDAPTIWAYEVSYMLYGSHFMLGASYTLLKKQHIRMDLFYNRWTIRRQGVVDATLYLSFFFPGLIFFFLSGLGEAMQSWDIGECSDLTPWRPPIYPFKTVIPVASALLILQGVSEFLKSMHAALKGRWP
jgi:TRAP-type mannitol/chloroaromatic compound transport system permease small subunit